MERKVITNILKEDYARIADDYMCAWCLKHEYDYDAISRMDDDYRVCEAGDIYLSLDDVRYDINNNLPENVFEDYYWYASDVAMYAPDISITLPQYNAGYRPFTRIELEKLKDAHERLMQAKDEYETLLDEITANNKKGINNNGKNSN